jgi:integrase
METRQEVGDRTPGARLVLHDLRALVRDQGRPAWREMKELQARLGHTTPAMALKYQRAEAIRDRVLAARMSQGFDRSGT